MTAKTNWRFSTQKRQSTLNISGRKGAGSTVILRKEINGALNGLKPSEFFMFFSHSSTSAFMN